MPGGKAHERINLGFTLTVSVALLSVDPVVAPGVFLGMGLSCFITPDLLDVDGDPIPEYRIRKVPIIGPFYAWLFDIISVRIPHRSWLSHSPAGTAISLVVLWWIPLLCWLVGWKILVGFLLGKLAGDSLHILLDVSVSAVKRLARRFRGKRWKRIMGRSDEELLRRNIGGRW
jgi:uncharacterized metal-binding protein